MRGARPRNAASMRVVQRSGGSNTWESEERISAGSIACPGSPERGDDLAGEELEAARLQVGGNAAARIQLGHDPVQPELVAQPSQPRDHALGGAEGHLALQDV